LCVFDAHQIRIKSFRKGASSLVSDESTTTNAGTGERLALRTDGASRGNPGPAAAGIVIEQVDGTILAQLGQYLGEMPNNQAEYRALILGLRMVADRQPAAVAIYMDSELVVRQMTGVYQVRDATLQQLYREAMALVKALPQATFTHVRRAQNALADRLANQALNERLRTHH
jgi:ribonuclease HI